MATLELQGTDIGFVYGNCSKMIICTMMKTYWNNHNGEVDYEDSGIGKNGKIDLFDQG